MKFEKTHLLDHYQAGAATAACSLDEPPPPPPPPAANSKQYQQPCACHLQTTRSQLNDLAMIDTQTYINEPHSYTHTLHTYET